MSDEIVVLANNERERKTRLLAESRHPDLFQIPEDVMYMISHQNYSGSLDWEENEYGYLKLLRDDVSASFDDGVMYANGLVATKLSFKDVYTKENLTDIDKPLLDALFSVVLMKLRTDFDKVCPPGYSNDMKFRAKQPKDVREVSDETLFDWYHKNLFNYTVTVYLPDLMQYLGYKNTSNAQRDALLASIVKPEIASAENKRAAEVVKQIALLVVDAGKQDPHIKISNLIERCYDLSGDLLEADQEHDKRKKRRILRRTFESVWKYIREYTDISENYTYEEIIPKSSRDYGITLEFHHKK